MRVQTEILPGNLISKVRQNMESDEVTPHGITCVGWKLDE